MFPILSSDFKQVWSLSTEFRVSPLYQMSQNFFQWETQWYLRSDRRIDMTKLISTFRNDTIAVLQNPLNKANFTAQFIFKYATKIPVHGIRLSRLWGPVTGQQDRRTRIGVLSVSGQQNRRRRIGVLSVSGQQDRSRRIGVLSVSGQQNRSRRIGVLSLSGQQDRSRRIGVLGLG